MVFFSFALTILRSSGLLKTHPTPTPHTNWQPSTHTHFPTHPPILEQQAHTLSLSLFHPPPQPSTTTYTRTHTHTISLSHPPPPNRAPPQPPPHTRTHSDIVSCSSHCYFHSPVRQYVRYRKCLAFRRDFMNSSFTFCPEFLLSFSLGRIAGKTVSYQRKWADASNK